MAQNKQKIISDIQEHIQKGGGGYRAWYVGISKDARNRLFNEHKVKEKGDWWLYRTASSSQIAREIEDYFVNTLNTDGGASGGDETADMVYAYKQVAHTDP